MLKTASRTGYFLCTKKEETEVGQLLSNKHEFKPGFPAVQHGNFHKQTMGIVYFLLTSNAVS